MDEIDEESPNDGLQQETKVFKALGNSTRLHLLRMATEEDFLTTSELEDEFEISREAIKGHLDQLAEASLLEKSSGYGEGNRPRDEYQLNPNGVLVQLDAVPDDFNFYIGESDVAPDPNPTGAG